MDAAVEWQQRLDGAQALVTAPFVVTMIVLVTVAILFVAFIERATK